MKIYTEEEVRNMLKDTWAYSPNQIDSLIETMIPIELPNEMEYLSKHTEVLALDYIDGFMDGVWWVKDKIQGGNK